MIGWYRAFCPPTKVFFLWRYSMKLYLICGKARQGKDTFAMYMKKYYEEMGQKVAILQLATPLKTLVKNHFGWDGSEETKPRELLQQLGTDIICNKLKKSDYFLERTLEDANIISHFFDVIIIADVRLPYEIEYIRKNVSDPVVIHIERKNTVSELTEDEKKHLTEIALDGYDDYDYKIMNTTFEKLEEDAKNIIRNEEKKDEKNDK